MRSPPDPRPVWRAIIAAGGIMPVSDTERARHARVQAVLRVALGLPEDTPEHELIDARRGERRSVRQLAELYLRHYAARLDPTDDLDDIDRAALAWHPDPSARQTADALAALAALGQDAQEPTVEQPPLFGDPWSDLLGSIT